MTSSSHDSSYRRKLALIIGNGNYKRSDNKSNPYIKNAGDLRHRLEKISFTVTMDIDVITGIMYKIKDFADNIQDADLILVYYSGLSCHIEHKNYLLPVGDDRTEADINFEDNANDVERILDRLLAANSSCVIILILDCCSSYLLRSASTPNETVTGNGLVRMTAPKRTFIQLSCPANETTDDNLFIKHLLKNIDLKNVAITDVFRRIADDVYQERHKRQRPLFMSNLSEYGHIYLNQVMSVTKIARPNWNLPNRRKLALVIGNNSYTLPENKLTNSVQNVKELGTVLKTIGFEVTMCKNIRQEDEMMENIKKFEKKIRHDDLVLFYFSGHGCQVNDENYVIPVGDADIDSDENLKDLSNNVQRLLGRLIDKKLQFVTILILDCCRPYLLYNQSIPNSEIKNNGLHELKIEDFFDTIIQFSCPANETATDNLFSERLMKNIALENVDVTDIFRRIAEDIWQERNKERRPLSINGLPENERIYINQVLSGRNKKMASAKQHLSNRRKFALTIGNDRYRRRENELRNSVQSAEELSALLEDCRFDVTMHENISQGDVLMEKVKDFERTLHGGDLILFYYSGHGCQVEEKNYLIAIDDTRINTDGDVAEFGIDVERILERLRENKPSCVTILILDCCRPYLLKAEESSERMVESNGMHAMNAPAGTFIQFSCPANETANDDFFSAYLMRNIAQENVPVTDIFERIADDVCLERYKSYRPSLMNGLSRDEHICLNQVKSSLPDIPYDAKWNFNARTEIGGRDSVSFKNRLHSPQGLWITNNQNLLIADSLNHRIMKYNLRTGNIQRIAGKNIQGYGPDLLARPSNVIFDSISKSFIICDYHNRRVLQWFPRSKTCAKTIVRNVACFGLAIDDKGSLYISDTERHEVRRYRAGKKYGTVVAGGNGQGSRLKQLNHPTYICIGDKQSVYVSDSWNDRVVKWDKGAKEGVIVAGGKGKGKNRTQLDCPAGVLVDQLGAVYVADHGNHRVMRWRKNKPLNIIAGDRFLSGSDENQLTSPEGLAFDQHGNLYVADSNNHRIQRFDIH